MEENIIDKGLSVLMSVYKKEKPEFLNLALKSIWDDQTLKPDEIVIVKDGALTDELDQILEKFSKEKPVKLIQLDKNYGLGIALNRGLQECRYDIVARMDSDDISKPNRFQVQLSHFKNNPDLDVVSSSIEEFDPDPSQIKSVRKLPKEGLELLKFASKRNPINHPVVIFKKESVLTAGGYLDLPNFEDYYLWVRMLSKGFKFYNCEESLLSFRFSKATYLRRGGLAYAISEINATKKFYELGIIHWWDFFSSIPAKFLIRVSPRFCRKFVYHWFLR